jgi:hypothetical protein
VGLQARSAPQDRGPSTTDGSALCWAAVDPPVANARKGEWRTSHYIFVAIETITGQAQGLQIGCIALLSGEFQSSQFIVLSRS